jgi:tetratricopeptide (TPR) repeat protein
MRKLALAALLVLTTFSPGVPQEPESTSAAPEVAGVPPAGTVDPPPDAPVLPAVHAPAPVILPTGLLAPDVEAKVSSGFLKTMNLVYAGRIVEAGARAEELSPSRPRTLVPTSSGASPARARFRAGQLARARQAADRSDPRSLDVAKDKADAILEKDPESITVLYRAGRSCSRASSTSWRSSTGAPVAPGKSGKDDLDKVLASDPNNPDALMIVGTYLYFADLLPSALKIASFILRIPGGDRYEGLEYLQRAEGIPSYSQLDAKGMRGAILFAFEGKLDDATTVFDTLDNEFPDNPRLVEPLAMLDIWFVERTGKGLSRIERVVEENENGSDPYARVLAERLRLYEAYMEILTGRVEDGRKSLARLHREKSGGPDWFRPVVDLYLADVNLLLGDRDGAVALHNEAGKDKDLEKLLRYASTDGAAASAADVEAFHRLGSLGAHSGRLDEAQAGLQGLPEENPLVDFYRGELLHLRGQQREALPHYERLLAGTVPARCRLFARVSRLRIAEIQAGLGDWQAAAQTFDDEIDKYDVKDMWRHVARARQRYFLKQVDAVRG